jgi:hypothetical protein
MAEFRHETDRLILRDWREEDWPFFWEGTNTPGVMRWLGGFAMARSAIRRSSVCSPTNANMVTPSGASSAAAMARSSVSAVSSVRIRRAARSA